MLANRVPKDSARRIRRVCLANRLFIAIILAITSGDLTTIRHLGSIEVGRDQSWGLVNEPQGPQRRTETMKRGYRKPENLAIPLVLLPDVCQVCRANRPPGGYVGTNCWSRWRRAVCRAIHDRCGLPFDGAVTIEFECSNCRDLGWSLIGRARRTWPVTWCSM
jgi:hypothetical protein